MNNLKFRRLSAQITQHDLEVKTGVKRWKLSLAERGLFKLSDDELVVVAKALDVNPGVLLAEVKPLTHKMGK